MSETSEKSELTATCSTCGHEWAPYKEKMVVPRRDYLKCPSCGTRESHTWLDTEGKRRLALKSVGLEESNKNDPRVAEIEKRLALLESQVQLANKQREVVELKQAETEKWAKKREQDFLEIERIAQELAEEEKMKEDGR